MKRQNRKGKGEYLEWGGMPQIYVTESLQERKLYCRPSQDYFMTQSGNTYFNLDSLGGTETSTKRSPLGPPFIPGSPFSRILTLCP